MLAGMSVDQDLAIFDEIPARCEQLRQVIGQAVVGQSQTVELLLAALICHGHVLLVGVPGLAKTRLVRTLGAALDLTTQRIQFTPDLMPSDIVGTELIQPNSQTGQRELVFQPGPVFAHLVLADEVNRAPPKTQAALLEAMAERQVTAGGQTRGLPEPFVVIATQNPIELEGTYPLPEAQLDRFMFSCHMDYPDRAQEMAIARLGEDDFEQAIKPVVDHPTLGAWNRVVGKMPVSERLTGLVVDLVRATRPSQQETLPGKQPGEPGVRPGALPGAGAGVGALPGVDRYLSWGVGPRGTQHVLRGACALAAMAGEPTPTLDHVRLVAPAVLRHRLVLNFDAMSQQITPDQILEEVLETCLK